MCVFVYLFLLQLYQGVFELEFLKETEKLYYTESLRMMRDPEFTVSLIHMYSTQCLLHVVLSLCACDLSLYSYLIICVILISVSLKRMIGSYSIFTKQQSMSPPSSIHFVTTPTQEAVNPLC